ncbi:Glutamyl-tRNA(Gln) amidotransferase subunit B [Yarrowia sp. C11]|nr:Glutamyl-tRNA(Gln) amidotransferase subunit B [Yarrowia sp. E02]KAG5371934.1 Glutamyl-tRNA(Gln) amidotransferase subunit B [Yarrowia sp. C11]
MLRVSRDSRLVVRATHVNQCRFYASTSAPKLVVGLEIHTQLLTKRKLFSATTVPSLSTTPNTKVSYFDAALPGTQPRLNPQALLLALKAAIALRCDVKELTAFDRKHYFYPDQPSGYQITQHRKPLAINGKLKLNWWDLYSQNEWPALLAKEAKEAESASGSASSESAAVSSSSSSSLASTSVEVPILQIQLEQDTGKSTYHGGETLVDLNRTNMPLIEIVTAPVIYSASHASAFVKKLQTLLKHIGVSTGEFESGAMRVDVNVSIGEDGERCEIKNLPNTSSIEAAIEAEYNRQVELVGKGGTVVKSTMGFDGKKTFILRSKENAVDYRYMPDPELPLIRLSKGTLLKVRDSLPELPDRVFSRLTDEPYHVATKDALTLIHVGGLSDYYFEVFERVSNETEDPKALKQPVNWVVNELLGRVRKADEARAAESAESGETDLSSHDYTSIYPPAKLAELILAVHNHQLTLPSARLLFQHFLANPEDLKNMTLEQAICEFELGESGDVVDACRQVMTEHESVVKAIMDGSKPGSIKFLIGMVMKATQGRVNPAVIERQLRTEMRHM